MPRRGASDRDPGPVRTRPSARRPRRRRRPAPTPTPAPTESPTPKPDQAVDPLTGGRVRREVVAVKVENIAAARPQVGLNQADIVFVEEVEGAQTRLIAVYHTTFPDRLGPVRSARTPTSSCCRCSASPAWSTRAPTPGPAQDRQRLDRPDLPVDRDNRRMAPHNVFVNLDRSPAERKGRRGQSIGWTFDGRSTGRAARRARSPPRSATTGSRSPTASGRYSCAGAGARTPTATPGSDRPGRQRGDHVGAEPPRRQPRRTGLRPRCVRHCGPREGGIYRNGKRSAFPGSAQGHRAAGVPDAEGKDIKLRPGKTWVLLEGLNAIAVQSQCPAQTSIRRARCI